MATPEEILAAEQELRRRQDEEQRRIGEYVAAYTRPLDRLNAPSGRRLPTERTQPMDDMSFTIEEAEGRVPEDEMAFTVDEAEGRVRNAPPPPSAPEVPETQTPSAPETPATPETVEQGERALEDAAKREVPKVEAQAATKDRETRAAAQVAEDEEAKRHRVAANTAASQTPPGALARPEGYDYEGSGAPPSVAGETGAGLDQPQTEAESEADEEQQRRDAWAQYYQDLLNWRVANQPTWLERFGMTWAHGPGAVRSYMDSLNQPISDYHAMENVRRQREMQQANLDLQERQAESLIQHRQVQDELAREYAPARTRSADALADLREAQTERTEAQTLTVLDEHERMNPASEVSNDYRATVLAIPEGIRSAFGLTDETIGNLAAEDLRRHPGYAGLMRFMARRGGMRAGRGGSGIGPTNDALQAYLIDRGFPPERASLVAHSVSRRRAEMILAGGTLRELSDQDFRTRLHEAQRAQFADDIAVVDHIRSAANRASGSLANITNEGIRLAMLAEGMPGIINHALYLSMTVPQQQAVQDLAALRNEIIKLRSGAQTSFQEWQRQIREVGWSVSSDPEVIRRFVRNWQENIAVIDANIRRGYSPDVVETYSTGGEMPRAPIPNRPRNVRPSGGAASATESPAAPSPGGAFDIPTGGSR